ncbi:MAG: hypothetical protein ACTSWY_11420 [Promethearchaeota archaeon]
MSKFALILGLDNIVLNNSERKMKTYLEFGWDKENIQNYISKKENTLKIASFNTNFVTFTASSRRNRYYEVYNRLDMLERDRLFPNVISAINKLSEYFAFNIISHRTEDLEEKTLEILNNLNLPMHLLKIFFKKKHTSMQTYIRNCVIDIKAKFPTGVALVLNPNEASLFERFDYTPVGFSSINNADDFNDHTDVVCGDWNQIISSLSQQ